MTSRALLSWRLTPLSSLSPFLLHALEIYRQLSHRLAAAIWQPLLICRCLYDTLSTPDCYRLYLSCLRRQAHANRDSDCKGYNSHTSQAALYLTKAPTMSAYLRDAFRPLKPLENYYGYRRNYYYNLWSISGANGVSQYEPVCTSNPDVGRYWQVSNEYRFVERLTKRTTALSHSPTSLLLRTSASGENSDHYQQLRGLSMTILCHHLISWLVSMLK